MSEEIEYMDIDFDNPPKLPRNPMKIILIIIISALIGCVDKTATPDSNAGVLIRCIRGVLYLTKAGFQCPYTLMLDADLKPIKCEESR